MKVKRELEKYFINRIHIINELLEKPGTIFSQKYFHQLRVEIKKINSLFELLDFSSEKFKRKLFFKPYKIIFKKAGMIREFQLEEATLKKYASEKTLNNFQDKIKKHHRRELDKFNTIKNKLDFQSLQKTNDKILKSIKVAGKRKAINYLKTKQEKIIKLLSKNVLKAEEVHKLRKHLKKYYYNLMSLRFPDKKRQINNIAGLQDLLGKWHDCIVIINHLEKSITTGKMPVKEMSLIKAIINKIKSESNFLFDKIGVERKLLSSKFLS